MFNNIAIMFPLVVLVGLIAIVLFLYIRGRYFTGIYIIGGDAETPRECVEVRVVIVPLSNSSQKPEEFLEVDYQNTQAKNNNTKQVPLRSKIDLGLSHPPVFVDLNSLEYV